MKNNNLPFQIGEQYENWEFDLEVSAIEKIKGYDSYYYIRDLSFYEIKPSQKELIFCLDILEAVILSFQIPDALNAVRKALYVNRFEWIKVISRNDLDNTEKVVTCICETTDIVHLLYGKNT